MILPRVTSVSERSISTGGFAARGNAAAIGLVPKTGRRPPQALIAPGELVSARPIMPAAAIGSR